MKMMMTKEHTEFWKKKMWVKVNNSDYTIPKIIISLEFFPQDCRVHYYAYEQLSILIIQEQPYIYFNVNHPSLMFASRPSDYALLHQRLKLFSLCFLFFFSSPG